MFYKCSKCGKLLTEFDINFTKSLKGSFDERSCECANCIAKINVLQKLKKPNLFKYIFPYFAIAFIILFFSARLANSEYGVLYEISFVACFGGYIACVILCIMDFENLKDESYETSCMRTSYDSSTNSLVSSSSTEYVGDDHIQEKMWLFFIYPVWGIFVYLYRVIKYYIDRNKKYTKEVLNAYNKTLKITEKFLFPNNIEAAYGLRMEKYRNSIRSTISKYEYLGDSNLKNKIKELKKPTITVRSNQKTYSLIFLSNVYMQGLIFFIKDTRNNKIIINNYAMYATNKKDVLDLFDLVNECIEKNESLRGLDRFFNK